MNVTPDLIRRTRQPVTEDVADMAFMFMEQEVGRFDWKNNWLKFKEKNDARQRVLDWLRAVEPDSPDTAHDPDAVLHFLDDYVATHDGRWK